MGLKLQSVIKIAEFFSSIRFQIAILVHLHMVGMFPESYAWDGGS